MATPGPRSKGNGAQQEGTHPDWRVTDQSKAGQPGSVNVTPVPLPTTAEMKSTKQELLKD